MTAVRFGLAVDDDNGYHVRFRLFAATGGAHLGGCGELVMRADEYAAFRALLAPALTDRSDPPGGDVDLSGADWCAFCLIPARNGFPPAHRLGCPTLEETR